jgi:hypothetical protein
LGWHKAKWISVFAMLFFDNICFNWLVCTYFDVWKITDMELFLI